MNDQELKNLVAALTEFIDKVATTYKGKLDPNSCLYNSVEGSVEVEEDIYNAVLSLSETWIFVENGIAKGVFPPMDVILEWIRRKRIVPLARKTPLGDQSPPTPKDLAYLISRKISEHGVPPRPYLSQTLDELKDELFQKINEALEKDVSEQLEAAFNG